MALLGVSALHMLARIPLLHPLNFLEGISIKKEQQEEREEKNDGKNCDSDGMNEALLDPPLIRRNTP